MEFSKIKDIDRKLTILIAPLDWGLGHATRCIPIIKELFSLELNVLIAAEGKIKKLLQNEFPKASFVDLKGYNITYSKKKTWFLLSIFLQIPKIISVIIKEHFWLKKVLQKYSIDAVISDNRLGLYAKTIPSVYITHQLQVKTNNVLGDKLAKKMHTWFIKKYTICWVPDFSGAYSLAGALSQSKKTSFRIEYIGCLSRFEKNKDPEKKYDLLVQLSGPEPQRRIFENILLQQLKEYQGTALLVRGLPDITDKEEQHFSELQISNPTVLIKNHLPSDELNKAIESAAIVICRSGYTSVMDLVKLQQKAILVPTPGQAEQEYLATRLAEQKIFYSAEQTNFSLKEALQNAKAFPFQFPINDTEQYRQFVYQFVQSLL